MPQTRETKRKKYLDAAIAGLIRDRATVRDEQARAELQGSLLLASRLSVRQQFLTDAIAYFKAQRG